MPTSTTHHQIHDWLTRSLIDLDDHDARTNGIRATRFEVRSRLTDGVAYFEIWWLGTGSKIFTDLMWDEIQFHGALADDMKCLSPAALKKPVHFAALEKHTSFAPAKTEPPLYNYHPQRVRSLLPFGKTLAQLGQSTVSDSVGSLQVDDVKFIMTQLQKASQPKNARDFGPLRPRINGKESSVLMRQALEGYANFVWWERAGRHIFDMPAQLTEMFRQTDIDDVPGEMLKFPYGTFYLAFGLQPDMELAPRWFADGAYVTQNEKGDLSVCVTARAPDCAHFEAVQKGIEPFISLSIKSENLKMTIGDAVTETIADRMRSLQQEKNDNARTMQVAKVSDEIHGRTGVSVSAVHQRRAARELADLPRIQIQLEQMLRLVVNAVIYLTAYPEDVSAEWPSSTPPRLLEQMNSVGGKAKEARNAKSKLHSLGYTAVHMCGKGLTKSNSFSRTCEIPAENDNPSFTWVRGFWLRQAYGPKHSLRKLQWRMPVKRQLRKGSEGDEMPGHIYLVT